MKTIKPVNGILLLIIAISAVMLIAAVVWHNPNFSFFVGLLFDDAKEFAQKGIITSDFMPIGYSGFLGSCMKIGGVQVIPACQAFVYSGILLAVFLFLKLHGLKSVLLALGTLAVAVHPILVLNVWRIHDGNVTVLLLMGFLASGIFYLRLKNIGSILLMGIFMGLLFIVRQNTVFFFLIPPFLFFERTQGKKIISILKITIFLASAAVVMITANIVLKGDPFFFGKQGVYNFFSGANEYALKYLIKDYSGENSHREALKARGFSSVDAIEERLSFPSEIYQKIALDYVKNHPLEYLKLTGLKLFTLLRPGYHTPQDFRLDSWEGLKRTAKIILAAPFFIWLFFVYKTRNNFFARENLFVFLIVIFYMMPFLIANADPRYRFPLDIVFIADSICRAKNLFSAKNFNTNG